MLLNVIARAIKMARSHVIGFQRIILAPSNTLKGRRLKNAMKLLTAYPNVAILASMPVENDAMNIKDNASSMFVAGPASAILPFSSLLMYAPCMYTAPGAANTKPKYAVIMASSMPPTHSLYSAQKPYLIAMNLWAISWNTKPTPTPMILAGKSETAMLSCLFEKTYEKTAAITSIDIMISLISLVVKFTILIYNFSMFI